MITAHDSADSVNDVRLFVQCLKFVDFSYTPSYDELDNDVTIHSPLGALLRSENLVAIVASGIFK